MNANKSLIEAYIMDEKTPILTGVTADDDNGYIVVGVGTDVPNQLIRLQTHEIIY